MPDDLRHLMPYLIPLLALAIPIVAIVGTQWTKANRDSQRHETVREYVRAGQPVPPELLAGMDAGDSDWGSSRRITPNPQRMLVPAVINLSAGLGLMGMFKLMHPQSWLWGIGLIPLCLGLGFLVLWRVERQGRDAQR